MAVISAVTFQWHLHLRERKKNNERVKNSPFVSFPQYKPIYSCGWICATVAEQNNDYNNYSHHLSQWGLVLFLLVKIKKKNGSMSPNFSFCIYVTSAYWKFYCVVVIPDVFGGLNPGSIPSRKPLFGSYPLASLNPSRDGNRSGLLLCNLCVPRSAPLTGTGRGHQGPAWEQGPFRLSYSLSCSTLASSTFRQPLCFPGRLPQSKKRCWVAGKGTWST